MEELDALLADLQNASCSLNNDSSTCEAANPKGNYTSVNMPFSPTSQSSKSSVTTQRYNLGPGSQTITHTITTQKYDFSPVSHVTTHTVTTEKNDYQHGGEKSADTWCTPQFKCRLFRMLSYTFTFSTVNGVSSASPTTRDASSPRYGSIRPVTKPVPEDRPTVESLLDDLQSVVSPKLKEPTNPNVTPSVKQEYVTTVTYTKEEPLHSLPPASTPEASSATKELDDLMSSLSDFKLNDTKPPTPASSGPAYAEPCKPTKQQLQSQSKAQPAHFHHDQLDSMLGSLQTDMNSQGVNTTVKGQCVACKKQIIGQVITALGQTWHPEHFTCTHCNQELGTNNFFERDGEPYCEEDYHKIFAPRCAYCNGPIQDKCVTALDKTWHQEHFFCAQCGRQFGEEGFHEKDGKPYCREDFFDMFAPKCGGCNRPIKENYISALNGQWHPDCFVCRDCGQSFNGGSFYDHEGLPYCETHYHAKRGSLCAGCQKPITGRCITAMFRKFHSEHFVCSFCLKQLNKGTFKEQNDKPYCHVCFEKLFG
ncbi:leupaxin-like isoform X2 [Tachypleus tridentatus]|uniref:leupaxin-like isoform X2 n=1 Tax=Tachypleus tridentatus TaxID=6853 RepID=UPI003FD64FF2